MDDERRAVRWGRGGLAVVAVLCAASPAHAQDLRGSAQVQYQHVDGASLATPFETWGKTVTADWYRRVSAFDFSARFRFNEQTVVGRPTRFRNPDGTLRFAHKYFGLSSSYTPTEARDDRGITTQQKSLALNGFFQKEGLPSIAGSWRRTRNEFQGSTTGASTITRTLSATYATGPLALRAGVGDRILARRSDGHRPTDDFVSAGATSQFRLGPVPVSAQYDFSQTRGNPTTTRSYVARTHAAQAAASMPIGRRTSAAIAYSLRLSDQLTAGLPREFDHSGSATLSHSFNRAIGVSAAGGFRTITIAGDTRTERFVGSTASAQGQARPGWLLNAALSHDTSWLPADRGRSTESLNAGTTMRVNSRISMHGDAGLSVADRTQATTDTRRTVALRAGGGFSAAPLRTLYVDASASRNRSGSGLVGRGDLSTAYSTTVRLMPTARFNMAAGRSVLQSATTRGTSTQASFTWSPTTLLHASASYNRTRQNLLLPGSQSGLPQESWAATVTTAPIARISFSVQYQEVNPHQSSHVRQYNVLAARQFGR